MACHGEDEVVSRAVLGLSAHLLFEGLDNFLVRNAFVGVGVASLRLVIQRSGATKDLGNTRFVYTRLFASL